jgi:hypothetical protein
MKEVERRNARLEGKVVKEEVIPVEEVGIEQRLF